MEKASKRIALRKPTGHVEVTRITSLKNFILLAHTGKIIDASSSGLLLHISRTELGPKDLRNNLSLQRLIGEHVMLHLGVMDLDLEGRIARTKHIGKGIFEVAIEFTEDSPEYWRECLLELLPNPGEFDEP